MGSVLRPLFMKIALTCLAKHWLIQHYNGSLIPQVLLVKHADGWGWARGRGVGVEYRFHSPSFGSSFSVKLTVRGHCLVTSIHGYCLYPLGQKPAHTTQHNNVALDVTRLQHCAVALEVTRLQHNTAMLPLMSHNTTQHCSLALHVTTLHFCPSCHTTPHNTAPLPLETTRL